MKDFLLFNECVKKTNLLNIIRFVFSCMKIHEKCLVVLLIFGGFFLAASKFWGDTEITKTLFLSFKLSDKFVSNYAIAFLVLGIALIFLGYIICLKCIKRRVVGCLGVIDKRLRGLIVRFNFLKFLVFINKCDEFGILNDWQVDNALKCCKKELDTNNYSNISSHPLFIIYAASLPASIILLLDKYEAVIPYWVSFLILVSYLVYLLISEKISFLNQFYKTKKLCQWIEYFDQNEINTFLKIMKKPYLN